MLMATVKGNYLTSAKQAVSNINSATKSWILDRNADGLAGNFSEFRQEWVGRTIGLYIF